MHPTTVSSSSSTTTSSTPLTTNNQQFPYPPISTLRRSSRPSNIDLSILDQHNTQQTNDPGIYSAPICYLKQPNHHHHHQQQHIQQTNQPYTATFQYQPRQEQHMQLPSQHHNIHLYQHQQQQMVDSYPQHHQQHTPHTFPLPASPNHYHQYFYFPPSNIQQVDVTNNNHQTTTALNNRLRSVQMQEQQQWSNPVLSPLMVKRINENATSMPIDDDDDEDPSASIDALVADVDSSPHDLLDDQQNKSLHETKIPSTTPAGTISPATHIYQRSLSHILTTPPNPLASDDHPDNQITVGNNFQKNFSPLPSAGFELTTNSNGTTTTTNKNNNNNVQISSSGTSFFTFNTNLSTQNDFKTQHNENLVDDNEEEQIRKPLLINTDIRTTKISSNNLVQDENSNQSSTNSSAHNTSTRIFSQILPSSDQQRLSASSSPLSTDMKLSSLDPNNNQTNLNSGPNRHYCTHPDCNKVFANKSALAKHKLTHSQDRKHKCPKCNKGFKRLDHLHGHMLTHEEEKPHKCRVPQCNRTYCDARSLKRHIENVHQDILAAIVEEGRDEYRKYLPETAVVKTKDLSINNDFSIDSVDSNSPRSLGDNEQPFSVRSATGVKTMTTYTFDEEKCVECQICKKPFKNGAALNGHMRLHGGFNEKQSSPSSSTDNTQKKKRTPGPKRKRTDSPSTTISIKNEEHDITMTNMYSHSPLSSNFLQQQQSYHDSTLPSRSRSASSSIIQTNYPQFPYKNPMSVQPPPKQSRKPSPLSMTDFNPARLSHFNPPGNSQIFATNPSYNRKTVTPDNYVENRQPNGIPLQQAYMRSSPHPNLRHFQINSTPTLPTTSLQANLLHHILRQRGDLDFYLPQHQTSSSLDEPNRYTPSPIQNSASSINITPVPSPYSNINPSHNSPQTCNMNNHHHQPVINGIEPPPSSSSSSSSSSSHAAPKKRFLNAMKQVTQDDKFVEEQQPQPSLIEEPLSPVVLKIIPDDDTPVKKTVSGFLIGTPSSMGTNSSSSTTSQTHFNYEDIPVKEKRESTPSSFHWPSQFRRQLSLNTSQQTLNPIPSTPYTPPPMLSPFRKGPGLYYRVFSHPGSSAEPASIPTTPVPDDSTTSPKINIGREYQASIPKVRPMVDGTDDNNTGDELLFSPTDLTYLDENALEKFEQLNRMNPYLFSPRHSPRSYPIELIYMLLYEYNGDLPRTITTLIEGKTNDIKQCRPIHRYRFLECAKWTKEEIDAYSKAIQNSDKNFEVVSRAVGTKTVKQCIEFHYMPKINLNAKKFVPTVRPSSVMTRRKRFQLVKAQQQLEDETSSSSFNEFRIDDDGSTMNSDTSSNAPFICDTDDCSRTFTSERAYRAHRKEHRRPPSNMTSSLTNSKRSRNIDSTK